MHRGESLLCVLYSLDITPHFIILLAVWYEDGTIRFSCFFKKYDIIITIKVILRRTIMKQDKNWIIATLILTGLTVLSGSFLTSVQVSADESVVDNVNITVPVSCSLSGTGMNSHNASIVNGTYQADIGTTTMKVFCNDTNGFAIYATGYTGNEIGGTNSNKLVGTSASSNATIDTGTATTAGNPDISNWAMKLATNSNATYAITLDNSFNAYHAVPNEYTKVAHRDSGTDVGTGATGAELTTTYAAYISKTQAADSYTGQVIYTLVHPSTHSAPVACNPNGTTIGTNTSTDIKCMQDFAFISDATRTNIINSMTVEQQYTLKDKRDGKTYTIAKYQAGTDSNTSAPIYDVWMTQNLDLDLEAGTTYTNEDTDIGYNTTTNSYDTAAWSPTRSTYTATTGHIHEWCQGGTWNSQYGYCELNDTPESYDPGNLYWNATESDYTDWDAYYNSCDYTTSTPSCNQSLNPISTYVSSTGASQYHLGNYYNWAAALATNDSSAFNSSSLVEQSICPAGWTLPRIGTGEDTFYSLWNQYGFSSSSINGNNNLWTSPLYFAAGGYFNGSLYDVGYVGRFWSPIPDGSGGAGSAGFDVDGLVYPCDGVNQSYGDSVRCVVRPVSDSVSGGGGGGPKGPSY